MIPEGYREFAKSCLNGNGGITATAYANTVAGEKWVLITIEDPATIPSTIHNLGPIPLRSITTLNHIIQDVLFINKITSF